MRILSVLFALLSVSCVANARRKSVLFVDPSITSANLSRGSKAKVPVAAEEPALQPALTYAKMSAEECKTALKARSISYVEESYAPGVLAPIRLSGTIRGIRYHSSLPERDRATASIEVFDCRLVLALDDFSQMLRQAGVVEVVHYSVFRPNKKHPGAGSKHAGALAIDVGTLVLSDGTKISVKDDFSGKIGRKTCPLYETGPTDLNDKSSLLWRLACGAHNARIFNVILTPNYNVPHKDHFHLEVTPKVKWFLVN